MKKTQTLTHKILFVVFLIAYFLLLGFMIYLSVEDGNESTASSNRVGTLIANVLNIFGASIDPSNETFKMLVRKLVGHYGLFLLTSLMGIFSILCLKEKRREKYILLITSILLGVAVAFLTEYIQGFSEGRGPSVKDSFIDIAGYLTPVILYICVNFFVIFKDNKRGKMIEL